MTPVEEANEKTMQRYNSMILVEFSKDAIHVTMDGNHYVDDAEKLDEALARIAAMRGL